MVKGINIYKNKNTYNLFYSIRDSSKTGALYRTFKHDRTKTKILKSGTDFASRVQQLSKANERNHLSLADQCLMFQKEDIRW